MEVDPTVQPDRLLRTRVGLAYIGFPVAIEVADEHPERAAGSQAGGYSQYVGEVCGAHELGLVVGPNENGGAFPVWDR